LKISKEIKVPFTKNSFVKKLEEVWDKVVLSKTVLSNFCPIQADEWIGDHMASLF
jgi:hypothetical protein